MQILLKNITRDILDVDFSAYVSELFCLLDWLII